MNRRRQSRPTDDVIGRIIDALHDGATIEAACSAGPIARSTFYAWRGYAEKDRLRDPDADTTFTRFADDVDEAIGAAELVLSNRVFVASATDWKAAAWFLERRFPARWRAESVLALGEPTYIDDEQRAAAMLDGLNHYLAQRQAAADGNGHEP